MGQMLTLGELIEMKLQTLSLLPRPFKSHVVSRLPQFGQTMGSTS